MPLDAAPLPDRNDIVNAVEVLFPEDERELAMTLLDQYDTGIWKERKERIQMATLILSEGSIEKLKGFIKEATQDYRNVLYWCEYTKQGVALRSDMEGKLRDKKEK
ncbi:MAG: hypothetical protein HQL08_07150 [Nitrospirae bacterium]|nr:hypothetical protein [Nitrospirota bacterium]